MHQGIGGRRGCKGSNPGRKLINWERKPLCHVVQLGLIVMSKENYSSNQAAQVEKRVRELLPAYTAALGESATWDDAMAECSRQARDYELNKFKGRLYSQPHFHESLSHVSAFEVNAYAVAIGVSTKTLAVSGYIYFMEDGHGIKIGKSNNPQDRLRSFRTGNPRIKLIASYAVTNVDREEWLVHRQFKKYQIDGEWFESVPAIREFISSKCATN